MPSTVIARAPDGSAEYEVPEEFDENGVELSRADLKAKGYITGNIMVDKTGSSLFVQDEHMLEATKAGLSFPEIAQQKAEIQYTGAARDAANQGPVDAAINSIGKHLPGGTFLDEAGAYISSKVNNIPYDLEKERINNLQAKVASDHPIANAMGAIAGGASSIPVIGPGVLAQAGLAAAQGLGEGDSVEERLKSAGAEGGSSLAVGGLLKGLGMAATKGSQALRAPGVKHREMIGIVDNAGRDVAPAYNRAADLKWKEDAYNAIDSGIPLPKLPDSFDSFRTKLGKGGSREVGVSAERLVDELGSPEVAKLRSALQYLKENPRDKSVHVGDIFRKIPHAGQYLGKMADSAVKVLATPPPAIVATGTGIRTISQHGASNFLGDGIVETEAEQRRKAIHDYLAAKRTK